MTRPRLAMLGALMAVASLPPGTAATSASGLDVLERTRPRKYLNRNSGTRTFGASCDEPEQTHNRAWRRQQARAAKARKP